MNPAYFNSFTVPTSWAPIEEASVLFVGTVTASKDNTDIVQFRRASDHSIIDDTGMIARALIRYNNVTDLSDIEVQSATSGQLLFIEGNIHRAAAPLSNET